MNYTCKSQGLPVQMTRPVAQEVVLLLLSQRRTMKMNEAGDVWSSIFKAFAEAAEQEEGVKKQDSTEDEFIAVMKETDEYLGYPLQNRTAVHWAGGDTMLHNFLT